jgi:hypothetical protein
MEEYVGILFSVLKKDLKSAITHQSIWQIIDNSDVNIVNNRHKADIKFITYTTRLFLSLNIFPKSCMYGKLSKKSMN